MFQKHQAVGPFPARVGIGEVHADIAQRGGAQDGVGDGVAQDNEIGPSGNSRFGLAPDRRAAATSS